MGIPSKSPGGTDGFEDQRCRFDSSIKLTNTPVIFVCLHDFSIFFPSLFQPGESLRSATLPGCMADISLSRINSTVDLYLK